MVRQLTKLFEPTKLGQVELRNRLVMLGMGTSYAIAERVTDRLRAFTVERAKGGVGLIMFPAIAVYEGGHVLQGIYDEDFMPGLKQVAKEVHAHGAKVFVQLQARGEFALEKGGRVEAWAPSPISTRPNVPPPKELSIEQIQQLVEAFAVGVRRARHAGFDGAEIHAGIGYLLNRFISSCTNFRTDQYGGNLEKRMRILLEIIARAQSLAGKDFPLSCRISVDEFMKGGHTLEDSKKVAKILENAGIVVLDMFAGWHECPVPLTQMSVPRGAFVYLAHALKKVVNIPVIAAYRINDPILAEDILLQGKADLIGMGRALIADPELPNKAREGRFDEIRPCIVCSHCIQTTWLDQTGLECAVNPWAGREDIITVPTKKPKKVLIVGGGPAGMEAAIIAIQRGHKVKLYEKKSVLGGQLLYAIIPPYKWEITNILSYLIRQVNKSGVEINLSTEANSELVLKQSPDVVIIATGAEPAILDIPGANGDNVIDPLKVLSGYPTGARVVIVGGGRIGCETAELLAYQGKRVTITSRQPKIGIDISRLNRWVIIQRLRRAGVAMYPESEPVEITANGIRVMRSGSITFFDADTIVLAGGMKANNQLAEELKGKVDSLHTVGDCSKPLDIARAINDAFLLAVKI